MQRKKWVFGVAAVLLCAVTGAMALKVFGVPGHGASAPPQADMTIDATVRQEVIGNAIAQLEHAYVFPEKAAALGTQLRAALLRGEFDQLSSAQAFADRLSEWLQAQTGDRHLDLRYFAQVLSEDASGRSPEQEAAEQQNARRLNHGFHNVDRLQFNIGYIDLHAFGRPEPAAPRIAAAMTLLRDTDALVIDLRRCGGGDPETVMLLASYLFDQPTHLNDIYFRDENHTEVRWTTQGVSGPKYGETRRVYLLTSADTFSACEDFAYALKNAGRATLVGENTGGGAHAGSPRRLSAHFMLFVPSGLPISPVTHTDWEGSGVTPQLAVSAKRALDVAQVAILREMLAAEADAHRQDLMRQRIAELD